VQWESGSQNIGMVHGAWSWCHGVRLLGNTSAFRGKPNKSVNGEEGETR